MYRMREATGDDSPAIAEMIRERSAWLNSRELGHCASESITEFARQAGDPAFPVWVLEHASGRVDGCTSAFDERALPAWGFTEAERAEPSLFLASSFTRPNPHRLGRLIARWALDRAARRGQRWVRRGTVDAPLAAYYEQDQGWTPVRVAERVQDDELVKVYLFQRPSERLPTFLPDGGRR